VIADRLQTLLWVEESLADEVLPGLWDEAGATDLKDGLERHLLETRTHVRTVRLCLDLLGERPIARETPALQALLAERGEDDVALAETIIKLEHYEIAAYTVLRPLAAQSGEDDVAHRLQRVLDQERYALELAEKALAKLLAERVANA
jgi:ferritin-like metal-binding protein YciE